ncbi:MAG: 2Fe-2S iron-sulfur cluster binding domain-containing protein [Variovorax sp.]|nr:2Fe-2S iron-sulfur cluster binding domain-containing protein [Variovorax sp.]
MSSNTTAQREGISRRALLQSAGLVVGATGMVAAPAAEPTVPMADEAGATPVVAPRAVRLNINGTVTQLMIEPRVTLLDALREVLRMPGTKKGCDRGQCGACTVLVDGRRVNSCLTLAVMVQGKAITTIEGLGTPRALHAMQAAFLEQDAFQCGYCTPGQICSAVALVAEIKAGDASAVSPDVRARSVALTDDEIRERMSGNLCRCGAYPNIVKAVRIVAQGALPGSSA